MKHEISVKMRASNARNAPADYRSVGRSAKMSRIRVARGISARIIIIGVFVRYPRIHPYTYIQRANCNYIKIFQYFNIYASLGAFRNGNRDLYYMPADALNYDNWTCR